MFVRLLVSLHPRAVLFELRLKIIEVFNCVAELAGEGVLRSFHIGMIVLHLHAERDQSVDSGLRLSNDGIDGLNLRVDEAVNGFQCATARLVEDRASTDWTMFAIYGGSVCCIVRRA